MSKLPNVRFAIYLLTRPTKGAKLGLLHKRLCSYNPFLPQAKLTEKLKVCTADLKELTQLLTYGY